MTGQQLLVSIIIPLFDHRGQYMECLQSFLNQSIENDSFEVVVSFSDLAREAAEIAAAFPNVRMIAHERENTHELYNVAIENSCGKYLYLTECHCFAEPTCVSEAIDASQQQNRECINSNSSGRNVNKFATMEQRLFDEDIEIWKSNTRAKITVRGFLVDRASWNEVGGFPTEFGHFSELTMGQTLQKAGKRFGYAERSNVAHFNQPFSELLIAELIEYGYDECHSNHFYPPEEEQYLCEEWQWYRDKPEEVSRMMQQHQRQLRWLHAVLKMSPGSAPWFFSCYRKLWETSIRVGRLKYLHEIDQSETLPISEHSTAA